MSSAQLVVKEGLHDCLNQVFLLSTHQDKLLGRSSVCHFQIEDPLVSSMHCYFCYRKEAFFVYDLLSVNGVIVNKNLVDWAELKEGDTIKVGKTVLEFATYKGEEAGKTYITGEKANLEKISEVVFSSEAKESPEQITLGRKIKKQKDLIVCRLALKNHLLDHQSIRELLSIEKDYADRGIKKEIVEIMMEKNLVSEEDIEKFLKEHNYYKVRNKDIHFGKIVVEQKLVDREKVEESLNVQENTFKEKQEMVRLGEILVAKGLLTIKQNNKIVKFLLKQRIHE
ncbi:MAG: FHA domain-containing protein [Candidatus Brocadiae bacterium]|nr:FHA domain-containing protein [Candidatus Brocadiia bacterium]